MIWRFNKHFVFLVIFLATNAVCFSQSSYPLQLRVDSVRHQYVIQDNVRGWTFSGRLAETAHHVLAIHGQDELGVYRGCSWRWTDQGKDFQSSIRVYAHQPVAIFSLKVLQPITQALPAFPLLNNYPDLPYHFSHRDAVFAPPSFTLEKTSTPWLFFNDSLQAFVLSPANHFMIAEMQQSDTHTIGCTIQPSVKQFPAGFTYETILVTGSRISQSWDVWGEALRRKYHRKRPDSDADPVLKYYGYWTDNGADYYYRYDTTLGYAGTLLALRKEYRQKQIPIQYMQLDSWWYEKSIYDPEGRPDADHKNQHLPAGAWNRYGGLMRYVADSFLFPHGLAAFQHQLGLPLVTHNRWIDPRSPYHQQYHIEGYAAVDPRFWDHIMQYLHRSGVIMYEQDWLNYIYDKSPALQNTVDAADRFTDGMAEAARKYGLDLQYCMAQPRYFLQGLKYPHLTTIRVSDDRFQRSRWLPFLFTSRLAYEMGIWPWTDVFKSAETPNMILSVLSAGVVGTGDAMGKEDRANILKACRADGVLVKPDLPILPTDADYLRLAQHQDQQLIASSYSQHGNQKTYYVFAYASADPSRSNFTLNLNELHIHRGSYIWYDFDHHTLQPMHPDTPYALHTTNGYVYGILAPVEASGMALIGDEDKIATMGKQRIAAVQVLNNGMQVHIRFAPQEAQVRLLVYSLHPLKQQNNYQITALQPHLYRLIVPNHHQTEKQINIVIQENE